jgi:transcriptional regulator with XRE-family HTH domain
MGVHERVRAIREERKLSQQAVADRAAVARSRYQAVEDGQNVTIETVQRACTALGLHLVVLTTEEVAALRALQPLNRFLPTAGSSEVERALGADSAPDILEEVREQVREVVTAVRVKARDA